MGRPLYSSQVPQAPPSPTPSPTPTLPTSHTSSTTDGIHLIIEERADDSGLWTALRHFYDHYHEYDVDAALTPHSLVNNLLSTHLNAVSAAIRTWRATRQLPLWLLPRPDRTPLLSTLRHHFPLSFQRTTLRRVWLTPHRHYQFRHRARLRLPTNPVLSPLPLYHALLHMRMSHRRPRRFIADSVWELDMTTSIAPCGSALAVTSRPPVIILIRARTLDIHAPGTVGQLFTSRQANAFPLPVPSIPSVFCDGPTVHVLRANCPLTMMRLWSE